jgi:hypothetical protein
VSQPQTLLTIKIALLNILEPFEYFTSHIVEKRKDLIPKKDKSNNDNKNEHYSLPEFMGLPI